MILNKEKIKFFFILLFSLCALGKTFAEESKIKVTQSIRYFDQTFTELKSPMASISYAKDSCNGKILIRYDFNVEKRTFNYENEVDVAVIFPKNLSAFVTGFEGGKLCKKVDDKGNRHLPTVMELDNENSAIFFTMKTKKNTSASLEFYIDISNCKINDKIPIDVEFSPSGSAVWRYVKIVGTSIIGNLHFNIANGVRGDLAKNPFASSDRSFTIMVNK